MISSNTRATRSRYSSPAQGSGGPLETSRSSANEGQRAFMKNWLEPTVQSKASFEEAGLVRYGVLENMAPLGALPKGTGNKKASADAPAVRIILRPSGSAARRLVEEERATLTSPGDGQEPSSANVANSVYDDKTNGFDLADRIGRTQSSSAEVAPRKVREVLPELAPRPPPPRKSMSMRELDDDYEPKPSSRKPTSTTPLVRSPSRRTTVRLSASRAPQAEGLEQRPTEGEMNGHDRESGGDEGLEDIKEMTDRVVDSAIDHAVQNSRYPTAWALRTLYDEHSGDIDFLAMIEDVYHQTADPETLAEFTKLLEARKKEGKKDNKGCYYFVGSAPPALPNSRRSLSTSSLGRPRSTATPAPASPVPTEMVVDGESDAQGKDYDSNTKAILARESQGTQNSTGTSTSTKESHATPSTKKSNISVTQRKRAEPPGSVSREAAPEPEKPSTSSKADGEGTNSAAAAAAAAKTTTEGGEGRRANKKQKFSHDRSRSPSLSSSHSVAPRRRSRRFRASDEAENTRKTGTTTQEQNTSGGAVGGSGSGSSSGNAMMDSTAANKAKQGQQGQQGTPSGRSRSVSVSSDSSLSSAVSLLSAQSPSIAAAAAHASSSAPRRILLGRGRKGGRGGGGGGRGRGGRNSGVGGNGGSGLSGPVAGAETAPTVADAQNSGRRARPRQAQIPPPDQPSQSTVQPITTRGKSLAAQKQASAKHILDAANSSSSSISRSSSAPSPPATSDAAMPGVVVATAPTLFPNLPTGKASRRSAKNAVNSSSSGMPAHGGEDVPAVRRKESHQTTASLTPQTESAVRLGGPADSVMSSPPNATGRRTRQSAARQSPMVTAPGSRSTRSSAKRPHDEMEEAVSPTVASSRGDPPSAMPSRAVTPSLPPPSKKQKTGLRVKTSPRKNGGTTAGLPRPTGEGNPAAVNGATKDQIDNDDYCSSCGANGDLVCCDSCSKSFHFECVDMDLDKLPDEWFCYECLAKRGALPPVRPTGLFRSLITILERTNPRSFGLPKKLQTYFEGVKAGSDGAYDEVTTTRSTRKDRKGYDEVPDFFPQRDADGAAILCHSCQKPATDIRAIIPCNTCSAYWHLDCLDPPLALPPVLKTWRCPLHAIDTLIENLPLGPAHRFRKVKGSQVITPAFSRGNRNNGMIEIADSDGEEPFDRSGWQDPKSFGHVYKLKPRAVVLDFIEKLNQDRPIRRVKRGAANPPAKPTAVSQPPDSHSLSALEHMAIVGLTSMSIEPQPPRPEPSPAQSVSEEPQPSLATLIANSDPSMISGKTFTEAEKLKLREMLATIQQALGVESNSPANNQRESTNPPSSQTTAIDALSREVEHLEEKIVPITRDASEAIPEAIPNEPMPPDDDVHMSEVEPTTTANATVTGAKPAVSNGACLLSVEASAENEAGGVDDSTTLHGVTDSTHLSTKNRESEDAFIKREAAADSTNLAAQATDQMTLADKGAGAQSEDETQATRPEEANKTIALEGGVTDD